MFRNNRTGGVLAAITIFVLLGIIAFGAFQFGFSQGVGSALLEEGAAAAPYVMHPYAYGPFFWGFGLFRFFLTVIILFVIVRVIFGVGARTAFRRRWAREGRGDWHEHLREVHNRLHEEEAGGEAPADPAPSQ